MSARRSAVPPPTIPTWAPSVSSVRFRVRANEIDVDRTAFGHRTMGRGHHRPVRGPDGTDVLPQGHPAPRLRRSRPIQRSPRRQHSTISTVNAGVHDRRARASSVPRSPCWTSVPGQHPFWSLSVRPVEPRDRFSSRTWWRSRRPGSNRPCPTRWRQRARSDSSRRRWPRPPRSATARRSGAVRGRAPTTAGSTRRAIR